MSIKLNGSSAGSVSFDAPADTSPTGTDVTLTLPTSAGSAGQYLRNSSTAGTLEFANGGKLLQIVQGTTSSLVTSTTNTFIDTGLSATINVSSASSDIYVIAYTGQISKKNGDTQWEGKILRGSTDLFTFTALNDGTTATEVASSTPLCKDSPNTTGSLTYKLQFRNRDAVGDCNFNLNGTAVMFLLEVAG